MNTKPKKILALIILLGSSLLGMVITSGQDSSTDTLFLTLSYLDDTPIEVFLQQANSPNTPAVSEDPGPDDIVYIITDNSGQESTYAMTPYLDMGDGSVFPIPNRYIQIPYEEGLKVTITSAGQVFVEDYEIDDAFCNNDNVCDENEDEDEDEDSCSNDCVEESIGQESGDASTVIKEWLSNYISFEELITQLNTG